MKNTNRIYWIVTLIFGAFMISTAIPNIMMIPDAVKMISDHLGYPHYFVVFIGYAKLLGVIAILIPGFPTIKEWAYAGLFFDLFGVVYSSIAVGDPVLMMWPMILIFAALFTSYYYHHKRLKEASLSK